MAIGISSYTDPGVYISEILVPSSSSLTSSKILSVIAIAPRTRRSTDEAIIRGKVYEESLTAWSGTSPYRCVLANPSDRNRNNAVLYKNSNAMALGEWSFVPASLVGNAAATADTSTNDNITLALDGIAPITITLSNNAAQPIATTVSEINAALVASGDHGVAYSSFASVGAGNVLTFTSPVTTSASDIKILLSLENDAASAISAGAWTPAAGAGVQADTYVEIIDTSYSATATYEIEYVTIDTIVDALTYATATTPFSSFEYVGSFPGSPSYIEDHDYEDTGNTIDWKVAATWAAATVSGVAGPYAIVVATNDELKFSVNGITPITVTLTAGGAVNAATLATDINAALDADANYGPLYSHVATDNAGTLVLTAPTPFENYPTTQGSATSITLYAATDDASTTLFNIIAAQLPYTVAGDGTRPSFGSTYYATYNYTRSTDDYATAHRVYNPDQLYAYTTPLTTTNYTVNKLAVAGEIAFENQAPSLYLIQINDSTAPGTPTPNQIHTAIDVAETKSGITDIVVIDTSEDTAVYLMGHVADQSSLFNKNYRRAWLGMARSTDIGDPDTPDTLVYRSTRTLQPGATSPARGRLILASPCEADRTLTLEDGTEVTVELDGSYIATAIAGLFTSFPSPADALVRKTITGFVTGDDTFETYLKAERHTLASNGVTVVTKDAGRLIMLDAATTEGGGSGVVSFEEPQASAQKDAVTRTVDTLLDNNLVGVVPDDVTDFIADVKKWIMVGIIGEIEAGSIGPYTDSNGNTRDINPISDIQVFQSESDPRTYLFNYWYNLRYPAKRFFGQYSVDNPFFVS